MNLSIVIPAYNEEKNVVLLYRHLRNVLARMKVPYEIIFVDDGSRDRTLPNLIEAKNTEQNAELSMNSTKKKKSSPLKIIQFRKNFGQTAAMSAGIREAKGDIIITMDADLQNDPEDIPLLLQKMEEGRYDAVSGWRHDRQDPFFKWLLSRMAYLLRRALTGEKTHDSGCTLKAYKRECFDELELYGEMHRFIPAMLQWKGFRVGEAKVRHHPRLHGRTKYNMKRVLKGFLDLLVVVFWQKYSARPIHLFGFLGIGLGLFGIVCGVWALWLKIFSDQDLSDTFLPTMAVLSVILGMQFLLSGILADIAIKTYYKESKTKNYLIKKIH